MSTTTLDRIEHGGPAGAVSPTAHTIEAPLAEHNWQTVVWDDPVNLMSYVAYVFRHHFGFEDAHAEQLMLQVHHRGSAVVAEGARAAMEMHVEALHEYGLWATVQQGGES